MTGDLRLVVIFMEKKATGPYFDLSAIISSGEMNKRISIIDQRLQFKNTKID